MTLGKLCHMDVILFRAATFHLGCSQFSGYCVYVLISDTLYEYAYESMWNK